MAKGTRITVDLGSEELLKAIKIAAVEQGKTVRGIIIEALRLWIEKSRTSKDGDFQAMVKAMSELRRLSDQSSWRSGLD